MRPASCILKFMSATTFEVSKVSPQAFNSLSSEDPLLGMLPSISFCSFVSIIGKGVQKCDELAAAHDKLVDRDTGLCR